MEFVLSSDGTSYAVAGLILTPQEMWYFDSDGRERDTVDDAGGRIIEGSMVRRVLYSFTS